MNHPMHRRRFLGSTARLAGATAFGSSLLPMVKHADAGLVSDPDSIVETTAGKIQGGAADGVHIFRGVPYGASTAGRRRFLPPARPDPWAGIRQTLYYGNSCPQTPYDLVKPASISWFTPFYKTEMSEDCLSLNVWTPAVNAGGKRPVMVWLHGGGYSRGSGSSSTYDGINLVRRGDVVAITINHRLNTFGYTHLGELFGDEFESSGNAGMQDIVLALNWVRNNIANFGGDPQNVMIYGESGGGAKVSTLMGMPAAKGLFHRAVIQSGPALTVGSPDAATSTARRLIDSLGIKSGQVRKLQAVPHEKLLAASGTINGGFRPILGPVVPEHPFDPVASDLSRSVPLMIGTNQHESALFSYGDVSLFDLTDEQLVDRTRQLAGDRTDELLTIYRKSMPDADPSTIYFTLTSDRRTRLNSIRLAERKHKQGGAAVYMYRFDWLTAAWEGRFRAAHAFEIPFVFDNAQLSDEITGGTPEAVALASKMSSAWIAFARSGNPNHSGLPAWLDYTTDDRATMLFNDVCQSVNDPGAEERKFWETFGS